MHRLLWLLPLILLFLAVAGRTHGAPICTPPTVWVEAQTWWTSADYNHSGAVDTADLTFLTGNFGLAAAGPGRDADNSGSVDTADIAIATAQFGRPATNFGHAHIGACIPERDTISASTPLTAYLTLFDNPGTTLHASLVFKTVSQETTVFTAGHGFECPDMHCETTVPFFIDPARFDHSGLQEVRFRFFVDTPDGNRMAASLNFQVFIANGRPLEHVTRMPYLRGKGWYDPGSEYCEGDLLSVPAPDGPVSGIWRPQVKVVDHDASLPVTRYVVSVDPDWHAGRAGRIVVRGDDQLQPTTLSIDTRTLANGLHRLVVKADCADPRGSVNSGLLVVGFHVAN